MTMYANDRKWCFVPNCPNTSTNSPNKKFVTVPDRYPRKKRWFAAVRRDMPKSKSKFFCCEDHFNFEEDVENYVKFKLMGGNIRMKQDVVPHIFMSQKDRKSAASDPKRLELMKQHRKWLVEKIIAESMTPSQLNQTSASFIKEKSNDLSIEIGEIPLFMCIEAEASALDQPIKVALIVNDQKHRKRATSVSERSTSVEQKRKCLGKELLGSITSSQFGQSSTSFIKEEPNDLPVEIEENPLLMCIKSEELAFDQSVKVALIIDDRENGRAANVSENLALVEQGKTFLRENARSNQLDQSSTSFIKKEPDELSSEIEEIPLSTYIKTEVSTPDQPMKSPSLFDSQACVIEEVASVKQETKTVAKSTSNQFDQLSTCFIKEELDDQGTPLHKCIKSETIDHSIEVALNGNNQEDRKRTANVSERLAPMERRRKCLGLEIVTENVSSNILDQSNTIFIKEEPNDLSTDTEEIPLAMHIKAETPTLDQSRRENRKRPVCVAEKSALVKREKKVFAESVISNQFDQPTTSFFKEEPDDPFIEIEETPLFICIKPKVPKVCRSIGIQVKPYIRSKYITCNIDSKMQRAVL